MPDPEETGPELVAQFETLERDECLSLLAECVVGRLALLVDGRPEILPVNYGVDGDVVVFRTATGTILNQAALSIVAFEVDDFDPADHSGWSVLVQGVAQDIGDAIDRDSERLRTLGLISWAPGGRDRWFRIRPHKITGRRIRVVPAEG